MYVNYKGTDYKVDPTTYGFIKQALLSGQQQSQPQGNNLSAFKDVLTNLKNEGTEDVAGQSSIHISGTVDVQKLVDAIKPLYAQAQSLGGLGAGSAPSPAQLDQIQKLVKSADFDVYSDESTHTLTRLAGNLALTAAGDGFDIFTAGTTLTRNRAFANGNLGFEAVAGTIDGGGNLAHGNGDPAQCTGVVCG